MMGMTTEKANRIVNPPEKKSHHGMSLLKREHSES